MLKGFGDFLKNLFVIIFLLIVSNIFGMYTDLFWVKHLITFTDVIVLIPILFILTTI